MKKILFVDMDNVLVDFPSGIAEYSRLCPGEVETYRERFDDAPGIFELMNPIPGAIKAFTELAALFDTYILSTSPWNNPTAPGEKLAWVRKHFGHGKDSPAYKRLILSHHKNLCVGDFLIDDRTNNGADRFCGEHIHFATERFPDWPTVLGYLREKAST